MFLVHKVVSFLFHDTQGLCEGQSWWQQQFQCAVGSSDRDEATEGVAGICHGPHPSWVKRRAIKLKRGVHIWLQLMSTGQLWFCRDAMIALTVTKLR